MIEEKKEELKVEVSAKEPVGDAQPTKEELLALKKENDRLLADNINYKQALTNKAIDGFSLEDKEETPAAPIKEALSAEEIDEEMTWEKIDTKTRKIVDDVYSKKTKSEILANEKVAKKTFFAENPEVLSNSSYQAGIKEYYVNRHGKNPEGIKVDMQDALNLFKLNSGISIEKPEEIVLPANIPNLAPSAGSGDDKKGNLDNGDREIMNAFNSRFEQDLSSEAFLRYKNAVLKGERGAPQEVINLFKSGA